ncbi:MAG: hypothetical protein ACRC14_17495 [Paracoccaceae bacterium]
MSPLEARLLALAAAGQTVTYGVLARDLGVRMSVLTIGLEALMEQDAARGEPLRAALCEGRLLQGLPAQGFFLKCDELGIEVGDPTTFIALQRAQLFGTT